MLVVKDESGIHAQETEHQQSALSLKTRIRKLKKRCTKMVHSGSKNDGSHPFL